LKLIAEVCSKKWIGTPRQRHDMLQVFFSQDLIVFDLEEVGIAISGCKKQHILDNYGSCGAALSMAFISDPAGWTQFVCMLSNCCTWMEQLVVIGIIKAKRAGTIPPSETRCLLPQPIFYTSSTQPLAGTGARPHGATTSGGRLPPLDLAGTCQLFQEICLDNGSTWSIAAAADIKQFDDMICPLAVGRSLIAHNFQNDVAMFAARLHLTPIIMLSSGDVQLGIENRTRGLLTGSGSVGLLAMLHILDAFVDMRQALLAESLLLQPSAFLSGCSWTHFVHEVSDPASE
jgi:hypothetical protein